MIKLLTIDDEKEFTDMIKNYFEPRGYTVYVAHDGERGIAVANTEKPDIVLIDLKMPGRHGDQVLLELIKSCPNIIPIMITASEGEGKVREKLIEMGAYECFDKPLSSLKDLEMKIKEGLANGKA